MDFQRRAFFALKRLFDIILAAAGLTVSLPLSAAIMLGIFLQDGSPVFFRDTRVGKNGRRFKAIKFRSMIRDAERLTGSVYASEKDPRITPVGRVLRATAMDELLQLINILRGDMSFVGPRPEKENYVEIFKKDIPEYGHRHSIRPGLTGPAQLYLKYDSDVRDKLDYDLWYIDKADFFTDVNLIIRSFVMTFRAAWEKFEVKN